MGLESGCGNHGGMADRLQNGERAAGGGLHRATSAGSAAHRPMAFCPRRGAKRTLVLGVQRAHELHPGKVILLDGVNDDLFWGAIQQRPFLFLKNPAGVSKSGLGGCYYTAAQCGRRIEIRLALLQR